MIDDSTAIGHMQDIEEAARLLAREVQIARAVGLKVEVRLEEIDTSSFGGGCSSELHIRTTVTKLLRG